VTDQILKGITEGNQLSEKSQEKEEKK